MKLVVGTKSDTGRVREGNEDSFLARPPLFVVADGMGGHVGGEIASATAVRFLAERIPDSSIEDPSILERLLQEANAVIWQKAQSDGKLQGMGTTCTLLCIDDNQSYIAHVGDSRAYLLRAGELTQLTEDHTLVGKMVKEGRLEAAEAEHHPQRSIITRALGVDSDVEVDVLPLTLQVGDRVLLCSDGLSSMIDAAVIKRTLSEGHPQAVADRLIDLANEAGGEDNVTVVVVEATEGDSAAAGAAGSKETVGEATAESPAATDPWSSVPTVDGISSVSGEPTAASSYRESRSRWPRIALVVLIGCAVLIGGGYGATRYFLSKSYFVGADGSGHVTIYKGIPEDVAGITLKEPEETTEVLISDLPEFLRSNVSEGIRVDSLEEAQTTVENLAARARDFGSTNEDPSGSEEPGGPGDPDGSGGMGEMPGHQDHSP